MIGSFYTTLGTSLKILKLREHVLYVYLFVNVHLATCKVSFEYSFSNILSHYCRNLIICLSYNNSIKKGDMKFVKQT